jgi:periplasmic protein TonB
VGLQFSKSKSKLNMIGSKQPNNIDDLLFSIRNKTYGAYQLRKDYSNNMSKGMLFAILFVTSIFLFQTCGKKKLQDATIELPNEVIYEVSTEAPKLDLPAPKQEAAPPMPVIEPVKNVDDVKVVKEVVEPIIKPKELDEPKPVVEAINPSPEPTQSTTSNNEGEKGESKIESVGTGSSTTDAPISRPDKMPEFPNGKNALIMFLSQNIVYPKAARDAEIQGTVIVRFVVNVDGSISNIEVYKGIGNGCDEEAVRVIKQMPKWTPGSVKGKPVRVKYNLPITFNLKK